MSDLRTTKEQVVQFFFWILIGIMILFAILNTTLRQSSKPNSQNTPQVSGGQDLASKIEVYESILANNPDSIKALIGLGDLYFDSRRYQEAIEIFERAAQIDPANAHVANDLGLLYLNTKILDKALVNFQRALKIDPTHLDSLFYIGLIHEFAGRPEQALEVFNRILAANPSPELNRRVEQKIAALEGQAP
ncbi:tetratricopeptide repeat protein [Desulfolithobacter sp.]